MAGNDIIRDKIKQLYLFIKDFCLLKQHTVVNIKEHDWVCLLSDIHDHPEFVDVSYRDCVGGDDSANYDDNYLLRLKKPEFKDCPRPTPILDDCLEPGWDNYKKEAVLNSDKANKMKDSPERREMINKTFNEWQQEREEWVDEQELIAQTRKLFDKLYDNHHALERESEALEMIVAAGFLQDRDNVNIKHPIITKRVRTKFDATKNVISIVDDDNSSTSNLYTQLLSNIEDINQNSIRSLQLELEENDYHPLDRKRLPEFLQKFIHSLTKNSHYSDEENPLGWEKSNRLLMTLSPMFILRKRVNGTVKAVDKILEAIETGKEYPEYLAEIVNAGKRAIEEPKEISFEARLAEVGGEDPEILLAKEANAEQLEIARHIERYNAVLVQGPPGTGKTHTIANLLGHFLSQGKNVLVTSQTSKALRVLKEKLPIGMQSLCVSVLGDSNSDMESSINGICEKSTEYSGNLYKLSCGIEQKRAKIIQELSNVRKKIFLSINLEYQGIVVNGEQ